MAQMLPILMFAALAMLLFSGYPVAFVLGGVGLAFSNRLEQMLRVTRAAARDDRDCHRIRNSS